MKVFPGGKGGRCVGLLTLSPSCAEIWEPGTLGACPALHMDSFTFTFFNLTTVVCHLLKSIPRTCCQSNGPKNLRNIAYRQVFDVLGLGFRSPTPNFVTVSVQLQLQTERSRKWNFGSRNRKFNILHNKGRHWTLPWSHSTSGHCPPSHPNFPRHIFMLTPNLRLFTSKSTFTKRFPCQKSCIPFPFEPDVRPTVATHTLTHTHSHTHTH